MQSTRVHPSSYYLGRAYRLQGKSKLSNPYPITSVKGSWFFAGWHDTDIEILDAPQNQAVAAIAQAA